jgi:predicted nucleic acid-binding protein
MIILDTTVLSALMRRSEQPAIIDWLNDQDVDQLSTTVISLQELSYGIELLPASRRRRTMERDLQLTLDQELSSRIVAFDTAAALSTAMIAARRYKAGRPVGLADTQIAGIAVSLGADIATHNVRHFADLPVRVIDPGQGSG